MIRLSPLPWTRAVVVGSALVAAWIVPAAAQDQPPPSVTFRLPDPDGHVYRIAADQPGLPEDVSATLELQWPGSVDQWLNISPDGGWLVLSTDRFDARCQGWECLALVSWDLSVVEPVEVGGEPVRGGFAAVASSGRLVVFEDGFELWAISESGGTWSAPLLLSGDSPYLYNAQPALSDDASTVVFDCGPVPYGQDGTALCEVGVDGSGLRVVLAPADMPGAVALHHPDYAPDGSIVFEADPFGEQIWRLPVASSTPELVAAGFGNDNSPCVLPDGRIASLWLERPGGAGEHELKLMASDGSSWSMLLVDTDVLDGGLGCGGPAPAVFADGFESGDLSGWSASVQ